MWTHDPKRDGAGCSYCGAYAQVNEDNLCKGCYHEDELGEHAALGCKCDHCGPINEAADRKAEQWTRTHC